MTGHKGKQPPIEHNVKYDEASKLRKLITGSKRKARLKLQAQLRDAIDAKRSSPTPSQSSSTPLSKPSKTKPLAVSQVVAAPALKRAAPTSAPLAPSSTPFFSSTSSPFCLPCFSTSSLPLTTTSSSSPSSNATPSTMPTKTTKLSKAANRIKRRFTLNAAILAARHSV